ncbi:hypothetical protein LWP59_21165 [Amycolatopsis acidiphila]|uniref:Histidine kinase n=1 Tax=Amycolatopsis acidiphila TaxID=715473 RepID=A0A558A269_9PSEU|nr:hypothetical protein [Amycolatopsis acidiphila]TVT18356.1 hypothetical protein FNH06_28205 [Amycolatopsis acidiphila]UIJ56696.1 hypothetical protein LWP59_21165 [Amycolatopsis acidiphila]GHG55722.1 hypothetical protein GCM10017788_06490 [Amycolatopsis acidiphila]
MKNRFARLISVLVAGGVLTLTGAGMAAAATPAGSGTSSTESAAAQVQTSRDNLVNDAKAGDATGARAELTQLEPLLSDLATSDRYSIQADTRQTAATAHDEAVTAADKIAQLPADQTARQDIPSVATLLDALLQRVLLSLSALLAGLLG